MQYAEHFVRLSENISENSETKSVDKETINQDISNE